MLRKALYVGIVSTLACGVLVFSNMNTDAAPLTKTYEFESSTEYEYPTNSVEFTTESGDTVALRNEPDEAPCAFIQNKDPLPFNSITSFEINYDQVGGSVPFGMVKVLLSPDGENWYSYNSGDSRWDYVDVTGVCSFGEGFTITDSQIDDFSDSHGPGLFYFRAYMGSSVLGGGSYVVPAIDNVIIDYYEAEECTASSDCAGTEYCKQMDGTCGETGVCAERPEICPMIYSPVCGCDGKTYSNSCSAASQGTSVDHSGECAASCSDGIQNQDETDVDCGGVCDACEDDDGGSGTDDFVDVPSGHPHYDAIHDLKEKGVISGYDPTHFGPNLKLRRGELLKIALNGAGINTDSYLYAENPYSDLPNDHSLKQFILYAYHNDIATGYGDGTFGPDNYSTHAEAAKMILNVNDIDPEEPPSGVTYGLPAGDLQEYVHAAMELNLLYEPDDFAANSAILRGYTAEIMYRILWINDHSESVYSG